MTMTSTSFGSRLGLVLAAGLATLVAACSGGGSGDSANNLALVESNLSTLQHWQLNRTMTFRFDRPVDLNSVNLNTISILREGVTPAAGSFFLLDAYTVGFQPTCPSQAGFADAGRGDPEIQVRLEGPFRQRGQLRILEDAPPL